MTHFCIKWQFLLNDFTQSITDPLEEFGLLLVPGIPGSTWWRDDTYITFFTTLSNLCNMEVG